MEKKLLSLILLSANIFFASGKVMAKTSLDNEKDYNYLDQYTRDIDLDYIKRKANESLSFIDKVSQEYNYKELYPTKLELDDYIEKALDKEECLNDDYNNDFYLAICELVNAIKENSLIKEKAFKLKAVDNSLIEKVNIDKIIFESLYEFFFELNDNIQEDFCNLGDIKIIFSEDNTNYKILGNYDELNKTITIYYYNIMQLINSEDDDFVEKFSKKVKLVLQHEIAHACQDKCSHRLKNSINNLDYLKYLKKGGSCFFIESSAESVLYNMNIDKESQSKSTFDYSYLEQRDKETLLFLIGITNSSIDGYYNAIFDSDLEELFSFFQLDRKEDIYSFYNLLYALDSLDFRTTLLANASKKEILPRYQLEEIVGYAYKIDLFKLAIKNLINYTINNEFALEDNIALYSLIRSYIAEETYSIEKDNNTYYYNYDEDFVDKYLLLDKEYISFIQDIYHVDQAILDNAFKMSYVFKINYYIDNKELDDYDKAKIEQLLDTFPILKNIVFAKKTYSFEYQNLVSYTKKRL